MATHSSVLAWRIPGTGEPGGLLSTQLHRVGHDWSDLAAAAAAYIPYTVFMTKDDITVGKCMLDALLLLYCDLKKKNYLFIFGCAGSSLLFGLSLIAASRGYSLLWEGEATQASHCSGHRCRAKALGIWASVVAAYRFSCSKANGIFLDHGWNLCPLHWQVDSYPLYHQGSPILWFFTNVGGLLLLMRVTWE